MLNDKLILIALESRNIDIAIIERREVLDEEDRGESRSFKIRKRENGEASRYLKLLIITLESIVNRGTTEY